MAPVAVCSGVGVRRDGRMILQKIDWRLDPGQHWVVLGPNGAGKSTFARIVAGQLFPTEGRVDLLGSKLGQVDVTQTQQRIGWLSAEVLTRIPWRETVQDAVLTGARGVTGRWRETFTAQEQAHGQELIDAWGLNDFRDKPMGVLSRGEKVRTLIARMLMSNPELLVLDEPTAGLDIVGREMLLDRLRRISGIPSVIVTHHLEEVPDHTSHALLLFDGHVTAQGTVHTTLTDANVTSCFGMNLIVEHQGSRWTARAQ